MGAGWFFLACIRLIFALLRFMKVYYMTWCQIIQQEDRIKQKKKGLESIYSDIDFKWRLSVGFKNLHSKRRYER